jgi:NAD(P)-dependent dehydrogenase (short-subunit alcohol dehydrogenase family)
VKVAGKLALVTGAGSGIGRATAKLLAEKNARVVVVDVDGERVGALERDLGGACALAKRVDVSSRDAMRALAGEVHEKLGAIDVLVNNAGVGQSGGILDTPIEHWDRTVGVNLWGVVHGCHFFVPKMVERGAGGHVVNIASVFGLFAPPRTVAYCATKFAVVGLSESMRGELAPHGIGVSAICPGMIATDIINRGTFTSEATRGPTAETFAKKGAPPEKVARAVLAAIERNKALVPVTGEAWGAWMMKRFAPGLLARVARTVEQRTRPEGA